MVEQHFKFITMNNIKGPPKGVTLNYKKENNMSFINRREGSDRRNPEKFNIDRKLSWLILLWLLDKLIMLLMFLFIK